MSLSDEVGTRWVSDRVTIHSISTFGWLETKVASHPKRAVRAGTTVCSRY